MVVPVARHLRGCAEMRERTLRHDIELMLVVVLITLLVVAAQLS